jgi:hypothetical protein
MASERAYALYVHRTKQRYFAVFGHQQVKRATCEGLLVIEQIV